MERAELAELSKSWIPPDGLNRSWPRDVVLSTGGTFLMILSLALIAGGGVAFFGLSSKSQRQTEDARLLRDEGRETDATITRVWRTGGKDSRHRVSFEFNAEGRVYHRSTNVHRKLWQTLSAGSAVRVRYQPARPENSFIAGAEQETTPSWVPYLVGGMLVLGGGLLPLCIRRQRRLLTEGRAAPAVVTRYSREHHSHGGQQTIIHYEFPLLGGGVGKGRAGAGRRPAPIGTVICVLYDSENPRRNSVYPLQLVKLQQ